MTLTATVCEGETTLEISKIRTDGGTQPRAALNQDTIEEYAQEMKSGAKFPPVIVFYDGVDYWLADGFHRLEAAKSNSSKSIEAEIRQGTRRDAVLFSVGANAKHGLRRTSADKRRAIVTLLSDAEWCLWSNNRIASLCGVWDTLVGTVRLELSSRIEKIDSKVAKDYGTDEQTLKEAQKRVKETPLTRRKVQRGGKEYTVDTTKIGQSKKASSVASSKNFTNQLEQEPKDTPQLPRLRQTVIALHPKPSALPEGSTENHTFESAPTSSDALSKMESPLAEVPTWWQLGQHCLFNGHPTSKEFQERIESDNIAFSILLPPWNERHLEAPASTENALLKFACAFPDLDWDSVNKMLYHGFVAASESDDLVVFYFLPHTEIFALADRLGCRCLIAEPDENQCHEILKAWKLLGGTVEKI